MRWTLLGPFASPRSRSKTWLTSFFGWVVSHYFASVNLGVVRCCHALSRIAATFTGALARIGARFVTRWIQVLVNRLRFRPLGLLSSASPAVKYAALAITQLQHQPADAPRACPPQPFKKCGRSSNRPCAAYTRSLRRLSGDAGRVRPPPYFVLAGAYQLDIEPLLFVLAGAVYVDRVDADGAG